MKKILVILALLVLTTGCTAPETGTMTCTMSSYPAEGITLKSTYEADYKNKIVTYLKTVEQVIVEDESTLDQFEESIKELYQNYDGIDYYNNEITRKDNVLTSTTKINYQKVDTDKLIEADNNNANMIKDGKVNIDDLKELYQNNGCNCKKRK